MKKLIKRVGIRHSPMCLYHLSSVTIYVCCFLRNICIFTTILFLSFFMYS